MNTTSRKNVGPHRPLNNLGVALYLMLLSVLALVFLWVNEAMSEPAVEESLPAEVTPTRVATAIKFLMRNVNPKDPRVKKAEITGALIHDEAKHYGLDPFLVLSRVYAESSLKPGDQSVGKARQEWGLAQVHGTAKRLCYQEMRSRGIDPESDHGQIGCSAFNLAYWEDQCGWLAKDVKTCSSHKTNCGGAVSAYLTGSCGRAQKSKLVASKVSYCFRLAQRLDRVTR